MYTKSIELTTDEIRVKSIELTTDEARVRFIYSGQCYSDIDYVCVGFMYNI